MTNSRKINPNPELCGDCVRIETIQQKEEYYAKIEKFKKDGLTISPALLQRKLKITYEMAKRLIKKGGSLASPEISS